VGAVSAQADLARGARGIARLADYIALTKPRILPLVIFTGLPALVLSGGGWPAPGAAAAIMLGISLAAAAANVFNMFAERELDGRMERTRARPLPAGRLAPRGALLFGLLLAAAGAALLWAAANAAAALLSLASILFYVFVYTLWLKPRSVYSAVVGGAAGAAAPLIADAAQSGAPGLPGLVLAAIVFFWQPPHVWAIALYRGADYAAAGIPTMPAAVGAQRTRRRMAAYTLLLCVVSLLPVALGWLGWGYALAAVALNGWFLWSQLQLLRQRTAEAARRVFAVSLAYLFLLFLAMLLSLALRELALRG